jgi:hypothetical protein
LRITPETQAAYVNNPLFQNIDANGNRYATIGAGPNPFLMLEAGVDRPHDVQDPIANRQSLTLPCGYKNEDAALSTLPHLVNSYNEDKLPYTLFPQRFFGRYSITSFFPSTNLTSYACFIGLPVPLAHLKGRRVRIVSCLVAADHVLVFLAWLISGYFRVRME